MGMGDNRRSPKMRRKIAQKKLKSRIANRRKAAAAERVRSDAARSAPRTTRAAVLAPAWAARRACQASVANERSRYVGSLRMPSALTHAVGVARKSVTTTAAARRPATLAAKAEFDKAMSQHCHEASRIMEQFAGEWFSKTNFEKESISRTDASGFAHIAMQKMVAELKAGAR